MIAEGKYSIEAVCIESGMSILELAAHVCTAQNLETLARVKQLHATQREMMLGTLKRKALMRLGELTAEVGAMNANEVRACEVMRKACADLLRYRGLNTEKRHAKPEGPGGGGSRGYPGGGYHPEPLTPAFEAEVLEALERLGEERIEDDLPTPGLTDHTRQRRVTPVPPPETEINHTRTRRVPPLENKENHTGGTPMPPLEELASHTRTRRVPPLEEVTTRTGGTPMPPVPPYDESIGRGQSGHSPGCPAGGHESRAGPGKKHGSVSLDDAHPP